MRINTDTELPIEQDGQTDEPTDTHFSFHSKNFLSQAETIRQVATSMSVETIEVQRPSNARGRVDPGQLDFATLSWRTKELNVDIIYRENPPARRGLSDGAVLIAPVCFVLNVPAGCAEIL